MMTADLMAVGLPLLICLAMGMLLDRALLGRPSCGWIERLGRGLMLGLGLVGALSIIRFRTPIKEPEELAYLFLAIAVGIGLGAALGGRLADAGRGGRRCFARTAAGRP